jgi:hypothetical protein
MENIFLNNVKRTKVEEEFKKYLKEELDVKKVIAFLEKNQNVLSSGEIFQEKISLPRSQPGMFLFLIPETNYFVNLKISTIVLIAFLLDITLAKGVVSLVISQLGISGQSIAKLTNEEKCFVLEAIHNKRKLDINYFLQKKRMYK